MVNAGIEINIVEQVLFEQWLFQLLRQAAKASPVVGYGTATVRNQKLQCGKVFEQIAGQALHEGGGVCIQIMRAGGVKTGIATGGHMDHGGQVVLHHFFVNRVPVFVAQRRAGPVAAGRIRVEVDADRAVFFDAFL